MSRILETSEFLMFMLVMSQQFAVTLELRFKAYRTDLAADRPIRD